MLLQNRGREVEIAKDNPVCCKSGKVYAPAWALRPKTYPTTMFSPKCTIPRIHFLFL